MEEDRRDDVALLLQYAEATYRAQTQLRRRFAAVLATVAVLFALVTGWATLRWAQTRAEIAQVTDETLIDTLGVRIPDPRPAIERGQLRVQALLWGSVAVISGVWTLIALALWLLVRPSALPPHLTGALRAPPGQPPM